MCLLPAPASGSSLHAFCTLAVVSRLERCEKCRGEARPKRINRAWQPKTKTLRAGANLFGSPIVFSRPIGVFYFRRNLSEPGIGLSCPLQSLLGPVSLRDIR